MNKTIIVAVLVIGGSGVVNSIMTGKPLTPVILGSYILLLVLSVADAIGGDLSRLSSAIAVLAMVWVIINEFPWATVIGIIQGKKTTTATTTTTPATAQQAALAARRRV